MHVNIAFSLIVSEQQPGDLQPNTLRHALTNNAIDSVLIRVYLPIRLLRIWSMGSINTLLPNIKKYQPGQSGRSLSKFHSIEPVLPTSTSSKQGSVHLQSKDLFKKDQFTRIERGLLL